MRRRDHLRVGDISEGRRLMERPERRAGVALIDREDRSVDEVPVLGEAHRQDGLEEHVRAQRPVVQPVVVELEREGPDAGDRVRELAVDLAERLRLLASPGGRWRAFGLAGGFRLLDLRRVVEPGMSTEEQPRLDGAGDRVLRLLGQLPVALVGGPHQRPRASEERDGEQPEECVRPSPHQRAHFGRMSSSVRRFFARPEAVSFGATGSYCPRDTAASCAGATPFSCR